MYGLEGMRVFYETCKYAKEKGLLVIADGKRNDIGSTAQCYSEAVFKPFIDDCVKYNKGIFVLVKSNKSSGEIQDILTQEGRSIYEIVAEYVESWGENKKGKQLCGSSGWSNLSQSGQNFKKDSEKRDVAHCFNYDGLGAIKHNVCLQI